MPLSTSHFLLLLSFAVASATTATATLSTSPLSSSSAVTSYNVVAELVGDGPVISYSLKHNSVFEYAYNSAAFMTGQGTANEVCLLVRCQNSTSKTNPLGQVGPSQIAISCAPSPTKDFSPITTSSVVFKPESASDVLGTEDPRVIEVGGTLYMYYTAVAVAPNGQGAAARLSLATCDSPQRASTPGCWKRRGALFPDPTPGFQFTKSGALLHDDKFSLLIFGDCSVVNGLQVARASPDLLSYSVIENFLLIEPRANSWDSGLVESGPPPLKLPDGNWFFIYNAAQKLYGVPNNLLYNPGYVILNGSNPMQVLQRSDKPLLMPTYEFQTSGLTPYVVFVEGMVPVPTTTDTRSKSSSSSSKSNDNHHIDKIVLKGVSKDRESGAQQVSFFLYYGAADSSVGVAIVTVSY